jgi:hypothetical protein
MERAEEQGREVADDRADHTTIVEGDEVRAMLLQLLRDPTISEAIQQRVRLLSGRRVMKRKITLGLREIVDGVTDFIQVEKPGHPEKAALTRSLTHGVEDLAEAGFDLMDLAELEKLLKTIEEETGARQYEAYVQRRLAEERAGVGR